MSPLLSPVREEFLQRLAALVPRPRLHLIRFHGVLAPHAKLRAAIVPAPAENASGQSADHAHAQPSPTRLSWARLLKARLRYRPGTLSELRQRPKDHRTRKGHNAAIVEPPVIVRLLAHLGLPTRAPPRSPARRLD